MDDVEQQATTESGGDAASDNASAGQEVATSGGTSSVVAPSRRDTIRAAFEKANPDAGQDEKTPLERQREASRERFRRTGQQAVPDKKAGLNAPDRTAAAPQAPSGAPSTKPPQSWNAQERQHWEQIPQQAKEAILRREAETSRVVSSWKPAVDFVQRFQGAIQPFEHIMRQQAAMEGRQYNPLQSIQRLMTTGATLMHGTPIQKVQTVAEIIRGYGVDVNALADALEGKVSGQGQALQAQQPQGLNPQALLAQAVQAAKQQFAQEFQASSSQKATNEAHSDIEAFSSDPKNEYFEDVKQYMADLIDLHRSRMERMPESQRVDVDLDEVYRKACLEHPVVGPLFKQKEDAAAAEKAKASTHAAQRASSSIRSKPGSSFRPMNGQKTRRQVIEAAYEGLFE